VQSDGRHLFEGHGGSVAQGKKEEGRGEGCVPTRCGRAALSEAAACAHGGVGLVNRGGRLGRGREGDGVARGR
jgi:hypothetical protein